MPSTDFEGDLDKLDKRLEALKKENDKLETAFKKKRQEFEILTNIIHQEWSGVTVKDHKGIKGLKTQNLRDHMTEAELIFTALAEMSTRQIAETEQATGMPKNKVAARKGGGIAKKARLELEQLFGADRGEGVLGSISTTAKGDQAQ